MNPPAPNPESRERRWVLLLGLLAAAQHKSKGQGLGLANVRDRLANLYDGAARITVQERDGGGVCARIDLPWAVDPMLTQQVA